MQTDARVTLTMAARAGESTLAQDVRAGLLADGLRQLPPKHLYDERGSQLFDQICDLPEYYPTRTERTILRANADRIAQITGAGDLVELGAGTAAKTRVLLDAMDDAGALSRYIAFDIEESVVRDTAERIADEYPALQAVHGIVGDFTRELDLIPPPEPDRRRVVALLGGTIGNFTPDQRLPLLRAMAALLGPDDHLLLGIDLVKDPGLIEAAYNDSAGVTARFNLNLLSVINNALDADFELGNFRHRALYDRRQQWVEMRLTALRDCEVRIGELEADLAFSAGEEILTEISAKFTPERVHDEFTAAELSVVEVMSDPEQLFALVLARPERFN